MSITQIPYSETRFFSPLMKDYLAKEDQVKRLYHRYPNLDSFKEQIVEKSTSYSKSTRDVLVAAIEQQYVNVATTQATKKHIDLLREESTFTITTGHQLNLFTGPLYFLYKIISTINLCESLSMQYPEYNFVPVYWMATEDHDFDEINFFKSNETKVQWNREASGPVGRLATTGLEEAFEQFESLLGPGNNAKDLKSLFKRAYLAHDNLTEATRFLVNELFGNLGLVIVDGDDTELKELFVPYIKREVKEQITFNKVEETAQYIKGDLGYKVQVNPREINLFYIEDGVRERIIPVAGGVAVNNTELRWTYDAFEAFVDQHPECVSPNALLRPFYQEVILPNLCYIGGGGELAYWLELKSTFEAFEVPFPMILLRNAVVILNEPFVTKWEKLGWSIFDLFQKQEDLLTGLAKENSDKKFDFEQQKAFLVDQFKSMYTIASETDPSFIGAVAAQEKKQLKGLKNLEKRLLKAEKKRQLERFNKVKLLQDSVFPNQSLQERQLNFASFYEQYGEQLINELKEHLNPLTPAFVVLTMPY